MKPKKVIEVGITPRYMFTIAFCYTQEGFIIAKGSMDKIREHFQDDPPFHAFAIMYRHGTQCKGFYLLGQNLRNPWYRLDKIREDMKSDPYGHRLDHRTFGDPPAYSGRKVWALTKMYYEDGKRKFEIIRSWRRMPRTRLNELKELGRAVS